MTKLFKRTGFYPYLLVVFCNSFVDLGHKVLMQDTLYHTETGINYTIGSAIVNALILLPYLLLFTPSGFLADKWPKAKVLRVTSVVTIPCLLLISWAYYQGYFHLAFFATLLLAIQSAFNSPAKYGYIKEAFGKSELAKANALVQTLTIVAILSSTFLFTALFSYCLKQYGVSASASRSEILQAFAPLSWGLIAVALLEVVMAWRLPEVSAVDPKSDYAVADYFKLVHFKKYLCAASKESTIITCVLSLAVFWGVNQVLLASYGAFLKEHVSQGMSVLFAQGSLAVGGIGLLFGASYAGKLSRGFIETGIIPLATAGLTLCLFLLPSFHDKASIVALFLIYGFCAGMLVVPLNAMIQFYSEKSSLGKTLAVNNFIQNVFMFAFLGVTVLFSIWAWDSLFLLRGLFAISLIATIYSLWRLPQTLVRYLLFWVVSKFYHLRVFGLAHIPARQGVLLLGNHVSFLDWAILQISCPRPIRFVMDSAIYHTWYLNWFLKHTNMIPISRGASKDALQAVTDALNNQEVVAIFPEGRLSRNGQVGIFKTGFERAVQGTDAAIIPFYIHGLWGSKASYASSKYNEVSTATGNHVNISYGKVLATESDAKTVRQAVKELSIHTWGNYSADLNCIGVEWFRRAHKLGGRLALVDSVGDEFSYTKLTAATLYFRSVFAREMGKEQRVGIVLPPSAGGVIANLATLFLGKQIVNLNFTASKDALNHAVNDAGIKTIVTSRFFMKKLREKGIDMESYGLSARLLYLEDYKTPTTKLAVLRNMILVKCLPTELLESLFIKRVPVTDVAAVLFSSGSEGLPKGVCLSHQNILCNIKQTSSVIHLQDTDRVLGALPLFHAFGLTATTLMPLIEGIPLVTTPDPTNAATVGKMVCRHDVTIVCATATFLGIYTRSKQVDSMMFRNLRIVISGAEKLSDSVRNAFEQKFHKQIYEGYGITEVSPVASCNFPNMICVDDWFVQLAEKRGSVGLPVPGTAFKIVDPDTLEELPNGEHGLVLIGGPQVMVGYLNNEERTKQALHETEQVDWYKTGDKGYVDEQGFLTIVDRYSRFAKIGGEMISWIGITHHRDPLNQWH